MSAFLTWSPKIGPAKSLFFDVVTEIGATFVSTPTDNPVEEGIDVSDHVKHDPVRVTLEVFVSNTPIYDRNNKGGFYGSVPIKLEKYKAPLAPTPGAVFGAIGGAIKDAVGSLLGGHQEYAANVLQFPDFDAVADTLQVLEQLRDTSQLLTVYTRARSFDDMHLSKITLHRNAASGTGGTFQLELQQIRQVTVSIVNAPIPTQVRAKPAIAKGAQSPAEVLGGKKMSVAKAAGQEIVDFAKKSFKLGSPF